MKKSSFIILLGLVFTYPAVTMADMNYFIDHAIINPGKSASFNYQFPSIDENMFCKEDDVTGKLASIEWNYANQTFKGQINNRHVFRLIQDDSPSWQWTDSGEFATASGTLVFTNLDKSDLSISCYYYASSPPGTVDPY